MPACCACHIGISSSEAGNAYVVANETRLVLNRFQIDFCRQICTAGTEWDQHSDREREMKRERDRERSSFMVDVDHFMLRLLSSQNVTNSPKLQANNCLFVQLSSEYSPCIRIRIRIHARQTSRWTLLINDRYTDRRRVRLSSAQVNASYIMLYLTYN